MRQRSVSIHESLSACQLGPISTKRYILCGQLHLQSTEVRGNWTNKTFSQAWMSWQFPSRSLAISSTTSQFSTRRMDVKNIMEFLSLTNFTLQTTCFLLFLSLSVFISSSGTVRMTTANAHVSPISYFSWQKRERIMRKSFQQNSPLLHLIPAADTPVKHVINQTFLWTNS